MPSDAAPRLHRPVPDGTAPPPAASAPAVPLRLLLTPAEAARALGISTRSLWQLTRDRAISAVRIGRSVRYAVADLESYVEQLRQEQAAQRDGRPRG
jgi:excisionase family DNA binding protein